MSFPLPTFVPGPVATVVALVLLAYYVASPPLLRWLRAEKERRRTEPDPTPMASEFRLGSWFVLVEVLLVMGFLGTASSVSPADIGWAPLALAEPEPLGLFLTGTGGLVLFVFVVLAVFRSYLRLLPHVRAGELPPGVRREEVLVSPRDRRELGFMAVGCALTTFSQAIVVYTVLFPVLVQATGSALLTALVLGLLGGWQYLGQGGGMIWVMAVMSIAGLLVYGLLFPGNLLVPVLLWASYYAAFLWGAIALAKLPVPRNSRSLHPVEVTMLDADGNPVERPGQGALDR